MAANNMKQYYDGTKILSMLDIERNKPAIRFISGNRTAGKTYFVSRMIVRRFLKTGRKFMLLYRFNNELEGVADSFFKDLGSIEWPDKVMGDAWIGNGLFKELYLDGVPCGYAVALNTADKVKRMSARFNDVDTIFMDEFQSETEHYCPKEIEKFQSIYVSVARGKGEQSRYVEVIMVSNLVTVLNPYFMRMGINKRLEPDTKFLRGRGWVLERTYNDNAATAMANSAFGKAFEGSAYMKYSQDNTYLLDNELMIQKLTGERQMYCIIVDNEKNYGVWRMRSGLYYVDSKFDPNCRHKLTAKLDVHSGNTMLVTPANPIAKTLKMMFSQGNMRFAEIDCKDVFLDFIGVTYE